MVKKTARVGKGENQAHFSSFKHVRGWC